jgi:hypothetical protein
MTRLLGSRDWSLRHPEHRRLLITRRVNQLVTVLHICN